MFAAVFFWFFLLQKKKWLHNFATCISFRHAKYLLY